MTNYNTYDKGIWKTSEKNDGISPELNIRNSYASINLLKYPTANCQVSSFYAIQALLNAKCTTEDIKDFFDIAINYSSNYNEQKLILIDIQYNKKKKLFELIDPFVKEVIFSNNYKSTNGSDMEMSLILFKE